MLTCNTLRFRIQRSCSTLPLLLLAAFVSLASAEIRQIEKIDIAKVWSGHPVDFAIKTDNDYQCVAYYDTTRRMVVAGRVLGSTSWTYTVLPTTTGWDSHNYIELAFDDSGYIHVSGNMHNAAKLIYFRSTKPRSVESFSSPGMIGSLESSITYPVFIKGGTTRLIFQYRDGGSGSGTTIWNGYDAATKKWSRITSQGLLDGQGDVNAYQTSPVAGPDGFFHIVWMWRDTPVANTNHHLSHIKSKDLSTWQTMSGTALKMPVTQSTAGVVVDPVQSGRGLINMDFGLGWDAQNRPVVTYHRYDNTTISQIFNTRWEGTAWKIYQTSSWTGFKWNLDLEGSLTHDIAATPVSIDENGRLVQDYVYRTAAVRRWVLSEATLKPDSDGVYNPPEAMADLYKTESTFSGMQVNRKIDGEYYLKWETMPINQDKERASGTYPTSSILRLYRFSTSTSMRTETRVAEIDGLTIEQNRFRIVVNKGGGVLKVTPFYATLFSINGRFIAEYASGTSDCCIIPIKPLMRGTYILQITADDAAQPLLHTERIVTY